MKTALLLILAVAALAAPAVAGETLGTVESYDSAKHQGYVLLDGDKRHLLFRMDEKNKLGVQKGSRVSVYVLNGMGLNTAVLTKVVSADYRPAAAPPAPAPARAASAAPSGRVKSYDAAKRQGYIDDGTSKGIFFRLGDKPTFDVKVGTQVTYTRIAGMGTDLAVITGVK